MVIVTAIEPDSISYKFVSVAENTLPLALVGHYSAHATAFTRTRLSRLEAGEEAGEEEENLLFLW